VPLVQRGEWRNSPTHVRLQDGGIHEYCPPEQVASEMDRLIEMHLAHVEAAVPPELEAAWLHHRFTQIHPFVDGNGRIARALATLVLLRARWLPLHVDRDTRADYYGALEAADGGDLSLLVNLLASLQEGLLREAVEASDHLVPEDEVLEARQAILARALSQRWSTTSGVGEKEIQTTGRRASEAAVSILSRLAAGRIVPLTAEDPTLSYGVETKAVDYAVTVPWYIHELTVLTYSWLDDRRHCLWVAHADHHMALMVSFVVLRCTDGFRCAGFAEATFGRRPGGLGGRRQSIGDTLLFTAGADDVEIATEQWLSHVFKLFYDEWLGRL
jgi:hypothetical protein